MLLIQLFIWLFIWIIGCGFVAYYLNKKNINHENNPWLISTYFVFSSLIIILSFNKYLSFWQEKLENKDILILFCFFIILFFIFLFVNKFAKKPEKVKLILLERKNMTFLNFSFSQFFTRSFDLLFQQILILVLISIPLNNNYNYWEITLIVALFYGFLGHIGFILSSDYLIGILLSFISIIGGIIFVFLILEVKHGIVFSYIVHWFFYLVIISSFWISSSKNLVEKQKNLS